MRFKPYGYQRFNIRHVYDNVAAGLFMDMGAGKTVCTLTAIDRLLKEGKVKKVLVIAPKKVAESVWSDEIQLWDHLKHLTYSIVLGTAAERTLALRRKTNLYIINRENVPWLVTLYGLAFPFDMLVIDELSSFRSPSSARFSALKMVRPLIRRVVGLTGTPMPNSMLDLWPELYLLDRGQRLGKSITDYRKKYFDPGLRNGYTIFNYQVKKGDALLGKDIYEKEIIEKISDICVSMNARDYLDLPPVTDRIIKVRMPDDVMARYIEFEKKSILEISELEEITAVNAVALVTKLLQFSNGAVYDADKKYHEIHTAKLERLEEIVETLNGNPLLVFYSFRHDVERIMYWLKQYKPVKLEKPSHIRDWNAGQIPVMLAHPASAGHGLNLQFGGHNVAWYGPTYKRELHAQANKRLDRPGQLKPVVLNNLICVGTMDEDVVKSGAAKDGAQHSLMKAIQMRIDKYVRV